jgi:glycosyltransferase involved in cell wall biosynthesis
MMSLSDRGQQDTASAQPPATPKLSISAIVPAFNEEWGIARCMTETAEALEQLGFRYEVIVIDDGSSDDTLARAQAAAAENPCLRVAGGTHLGKGSALIRGAHSARGELVLFLDADLEVHPRQLEILYRALIDQHADVVIGSKLMRSSRIDYPLKRRILSIGYYLLIRTLFRLPIHDTQTGLKLYRREVLERVAPRLLVKAFAHDLEALVNAHRLGYRIVEAPVVVTRERPFPRIGLLTALHVAWDTAAVWYRTYLLRYYDRAGALVDANLATREQLRARDSIPYPIDE